MAYEKLAKYLDKRGLKVKADKSNARALKDTAPKTIVELNKKVDALIDALTSVEGGA